MKTIIAGTRTIHSYSMVERAIQQSGFKITEVVCGMARGVDIMGKLWAEHNDIPVKKLYAKWARDGRAAGILRNQKMGDYAQALIAIWDGVSPGTKHMIEYAKKKGLKVFVFYPQLYKLK